MFRPSESLCMKTSGSSDFFNSCVPRNSSLMISKSVPLRGFLVTGTSSKGRRVNAVWSFTSKDGKRHPDSTCGTLGHPSSSHIKPWTLDLGSWTLSLGLGLELIYSVISHAALLVFNNSWLMRTSTGAASLAGLLMEGMLAPTFSNQVCNILRYCMMWAVQSHGTSFAGPADPEAPLGPVDPGPVDREQSADHLPTSMALCRKLHHAKATSQSRHGKGDAALKWQSSMQIAHCW